MVDVLLINDDRDFLLTLAEGLRMLSKEFHIITTDRAETAIEIMKTIVVDVVVTDLNMPGTMDGFGVLRRLEKTHPHVPVIILFANCAAGINDQLRGLRFAAYLEKPVDLPDIARSILAHARAAAQQASKNEQMTAVNAA
jgi:DNA-binding response OmpR family regulator